MNLPLLNKTEDDNHHNSKGNTPKKHKKFGMIQQVDAPEKVSLFLDIVIQTSPKTIRELEQMKYQFSAQHKIDLIQNRDIISLAQRREIDLPEPLKKIIQKRAIRTISGVSPIGILTKPYPCPGKCVYCPTEDRMPKSYLSSQPAAARAVRNKFHPYKQVYSRLVALQESGHPVSKLEVIVMGGTWSFLPHRYQSWYVKKCFEAANDFSLDQSDKQNNKIIQEQKKRTTKNINKEQITNETAKHRIVGLTLETRPDFINAKELVRMRKLGCTRIEIGVQTLDDKVQRLTKRGHERRHVIRAMRLMKDFGFKVCFHLMPGLPGTTIEKDLEWMKEVFQNSDFCPDFIKIYPCVVLDTAELKKWWEEGKYIPYDDKTLIKLLVQWQTYVPEWTRIMRLMRDIPLNYILGGAKFSNLRQILTSQPKKLKSIVGDEFFFKNNLDKKGFSCRDIRSREIGFADLEKAKQQINFRENFTPVLVRRDYKASEGTEVFLSFETQDKENLFALLRLRKPSSPNFQYFPSVLSHAALIREVHSYGSEIAVGDDAGIGQHRGLGKKLIIEAERIARDEWGMKRITVIAGVGTRDYYRKFGYVLRSTYMTKKL